MVTNDQILAYRLGVQEVESIVRRAVGNGEYIKFDRTDAQIQNPIDRFAKNIREPNIFDCMFMGVMHGNRVYDHFRRYCSNPITSCVAASVQIDIANLVTRWSTNAEKSAMHYAATDILKDPHIIYFFRLGMSVAINASTKMFRESIKINIDDKSILSYLQGVDTKAADDCVLLGMQYVYEKTHIAMSSYFCTIRKMWKDCQKFVDKDNKFMIKAENILAKAKSNGS